MHPLNRLRRHRPRNMNLLIRILHLKLEPAHDARNRTSQLGARKVLSNTRALAMQERDLREIRRRATVAITRLVALLVRIDPALRTILVAGIAPEVRPAVRGVGTEDDARALWYAFPCYGGIAHGFADRGRYRWVQTEDLLADAVEEGHVFEVVPGDGMVGGGDAGTDLLPEAGLHVRVLAELETAPS